MGILDHLAHRNNANNYEYEQKIIIQQNDPSSALFSAITFEDLNISDELLKGIYEMKFIKPSKIQSVALPMILKNPPEHFIGQAQSGTGKTATFGIGMISRCDPNINKPQALCVAPTRELARQIHSVVDQISKFSKLQTFLAIPGSYIQGYNINAAIIIGTPGCVENLIKKKKIDTSCLNVFVLDEADVMVGEGIMRDRSIAIKNAIRNMNCQIILFSATYPINVRTFASKMAPQHNRVTMKKEKLTLDGIKQFWINCETYEKKEDMLSTLFSMMNVGKCIIFVHSRESCKSLTMLMRERGHSVGIIHGFDMDRTTRDQIIDEFRVGTTKVLITTNVLARGIDVLGVSLVINFNVPIKYESGEPDAETYLHRIGRTGRFGRKGTAINLVAGRKSIETLMAIEEYFQKEIVELNANDIEELEKALE